MSGQALHFDPYQNRIRQWQRGRKASGIFAGCGLGKTCVTLDWIDWLITTGRSPGVLIVAPLRVGLISWPNEIARWKKFSWMPIADMRTPEGQAMWESGSAAVYIINYDLLATREVTVPCPDCKTAREAEAKRQSVELGVPVKATEVIVPCQHCLHKKTGKPTGQRKRKDKGFIDRFLKPAKYRKDPRVNAIVLDELSTFKAADGKRAAALRAWMQGENDLFPYRTGLTGTPAENGYTDLFNEIRMLDNGERLGTSVTAFRETYFRKEHPNSFKWILQDGAKEKIDRKLADLCLVMRSEDYLDIPETRYEDILCPMPEKAWKDYKVLEKELLVELETGEITALSAAALSTKLLQFTSGLVYSSDKAVHKVHGHKIAALRKLVKKHAGEPLLVLTAYQHEMANVLKEFPEARKFHEKDLGAWQRGEIPMWVANPASLSHGVNGIQVSGRIAIWMTLPYGGRYNQTNARLARRGQDKETIIYRLLVPLSIDEAVVSILDSKDEEQNGLMASVRALQTLASAR